MRCGLRVGAYAFLLTTDRYPPFRLSEKRLRLQRRTTGGRGLRHRLPRRWVTIGC